MGKRARVIGSTSKEKQSPNALKDIKTKEKMKEIRQKQDRTKKVRKKTKKCPLKIAQRKEKQSAKAPNKQTKQNIKTKNKIRKNVSTGSRKLHATEVEKSKQKKDQSCSAPLHLRKT